MQEGSVRGGREGLVFSAFCQSDSQSSRVGPSAIRMLFSSTYRTILANYRKKAFPAACLAPTLTIAQRTDACELDLSWISNSPGQLATSRLGYMGFAIFLRSHYTFILSLCIRFKEYGYVDVCYPKDGRPPCNDFFYQVGYHLATAEVALADPSLH